MISPVTVTSLASFFFLSCAEPIASANRTSGRTMSEVFFMNDDSRSEFARFFLVYEIFPLFSLLVIPERLGEFFPYFRDPRFIRGMRAHKLRRSLALVLLRHALPEGQRLIRVVTRSEEHTSE